MSPIRITNIILISAIIALFFIIPVSAGEIDSFTVTEGTDWDDYYEITCSGSITGNVTSWVLDYDDGDSYEGSGTSVSKTHNYPTPDDYTVPDEYEVTLTVTFDDNTTDEETATATIEEPTLVASADITVAEDTFTITYSSDTDGAEEYSWNFGDGDSSSSSGGDHTYSAAGIYNVTLTVTSTGGQDAEYTEDVTLTATDPTPTAYFSVDYNIGSSPLYVKFTDESTENSDSDADLEEWEWLFDYGSYGDDFDVDDDDFEDADTEYTYNVIGTYYPTLTVTDEDGYEDTYEYDCIEVVAADDAPVADFEIDEDYADYGSAPFTVKFNDLSEESENSESDLDEWYWEFYDEDNDDIDVITSTSQNPVIEFEDAGGYTVRLTVVDDDGICSTEVKKDLIEVTSTISASFSASPASGNAPLKVTFTANSGDYNIDEYYWNFGDGDKSSETDTTTSHTYSSAGTYKVTLTVYEGSNSYTTSAKTITVNAKSTTPTVTYAVETTAAATETETTNLGSSSTGTQIFGLPGTEFFRGEMDRYYDFYQEWMSLLGGLFGWSDDSSS